MIDEMGWCPCMKPHILCIKLYMFVILGGLFHCFYYPVFAVYMCVCMFVCEMKYLTYLNSADSEAVFRNGSMVKKTHLLLQVASVRHVK